MVKRRGFILPFSLMLALVVLTSLGLWFRQVVLQGFLAERLLVQRSEYIECRSFLPALKEKLDQLSLQELQSPVTRFMEVDVDGLARWQIDRSQFEQGRVRFSFFRVGRGDEPLVLVMPYERK